MPPSNNETILLVDDEPQVVTLVQDMLTRGGFHVLGASERQEAIETVRQLQGKVDLLLTDIVMPQMNGTEPAGRLRSARLVRCVLYMSGFMKEAILKYYGIPIAGIPFVQKPFTRETLLRKVRDILDAPATSAAHRAELREARRSC